MTNWRNKPSISNLKEDLNKKYGKDFSMNLRNTCLDDFSNVLQKFSNNFGKTILVGANNLEEVNYFPDFDLLVGVDLAYSAFNNIKSDRKNIIPVIANAKELPFPKDYFDTYIALRALFSTHTDLETCINEAMRITKESGTIILSIPNGYLIGKEVIKGMYDYETNSNETEKPYKFLETVKQIAHSLSCSVEHAEIESEILIKLTK